MVCVFLPMPDLHAEVLHEEIWPCYMEKNYNHCKPHMCSGTEERKPHQKGEEMQSQDNQDIQKQARKRLLDGQRAPERDRASKLNSFL